MNLPIICLKSKDDQRLRNGHLWIYSNEIDSQKTPLTNLNAGDIVVIENNNGKKLGLAYINPHTLICARLLSQNITHKLDEDFFKQRILAALELRQALFTSQCYRLIYGESDFLPGLVVDRYYDLLVVQISTAGMERLRDLIIKALDTSIKPAAIVLKNDGKMREVEGLNNYIEWIKGTPTEHAQLEENGVKFNAPIMQGQKTGWFYDHRMIRARMHDYVQGKRVLDVFSYIGGWGIQAASFGAKEVILTDISEFALQQAQQHTKLNNLNNVATICGDAFVVMDKLFNAGEQFDIVILDPPAFIPRRKDLHKGLAAYQKANLQAMRLLKHNGILISGSCSMHLPADELRAAILRAGNKLERQVQILEQGHQSPDHPIHPAIPETEYLKSFICRII